MPVKCPAQDPRQVPLVSRPTGHERPESRGRAEGPKGTYGGASAFPPRDCTGGRETNRSKNLVLDISSGGEPFESQRDPASRTIPSRLAISTGNGGES